MIKFQRKYIPSLFTILNLFSGFLAILQIMEHHYITAVMLIMLASVFDFVDGKVARWMNQESQFGIEIDSLSDIVSFCVVPALMINNIYVADLGIKSGIISFFPLLFGAIRLARFNTFATEGKKSYFIGLPVPANALIIGSYVWFQKTLTSEFGDAKIILPMVIVLSFLMVSNIHFDSMPRLTFKNGLISTIKTILVVAGVVLVIIFKGYILFPIAMVYIITHILLWIVGNEDHHLKAIIKKKGI